MSTSGVRRRKRKYKDISMFSYNDMPGKNKCDSERLFPTWKYIHP
jgi:hypothetical protein